MAPVFTAARVQELRPTYLPPDPPAGPAMRPARPHSTICVPGHPAAGRVWTDTDRLTVVGVDDGDRLLAVVFGATDPVAQADDLFAGW